MVIILERIRWYHSVRWKLTIVLFLIMLLTLLVLNGYLVRDLNNYFINHKGIELMTQANIAANMCADYFNDKKMMDLAIDEIPLDKNIRIIVTNTEASVIYDSAEISSLEGKTFLRQEVVYALDGKDGYNTYHNENDWIINAAVPIINEGKILGVVFLTSSAKDIKMILNDLKKSILTVIIIVSLLIGVVSLISASIFTRRIKVLTKAIEYMNAGNLNHTVSLKGKDEITQMANAFNNMSLRLYKNEEKRKKFVSDASHELKTPLSSIKVLTQSILNMTVFNKEVVFEFLNDIDKEVDRLSKITNKLIKLTRMDEEDTSLVYEEIKLSQVLNDVFTRIKPIANEKNIEIDLNIKDDVLVKSDKDKIWEALYNIAENAVKYTSSGGKVSSGIIKERNSIKIYISDSGIGIPEEELNKVFERFYRVDKARARDTGGTGLGLSIALTAIKKIGGTINVESNVGKGSVFNIYIPYR